jgi:hypothetical protein
MELNQLNISFLEFVLFMWGVIATIAAMQYREEKRHLTRLLQHIIENKTVRDQIVAAHDEFVARVNKEFNK